MTLDDPSITPESAAVVQDLSRPVQRLTDAAAALPKASGLYAWWANPKVLPTLPGPAHDTDLDMRLLYVGIASNLRRRVVQNHLRQSGSSTLRRTLAGLLLDVESYRTRWTDRVVLVDSDELRLTAWMQANLRLTWVEHPTPAIVEPGIITALRPPLNVDHASGPLRDVVKAAKAAYADSAGIKPS